VTEVKDGENAHCQGTEIGHQRNKEGYSTRQVAIASAASAVLPPKLFKSASSAGLTEGLSKVVESTPKLMEELEEELAILEVEIKSKNKKP
jgi:hypothetical protein